jgi:hypothetical protein
MNVIKGVEIFASGQHNGDQFTEKDLDDIAAASKELDYVPVLKLGHSRDEPGAPAYGFVVNLRRVGTKLLADFESMHDSVVQAIRDRRYTKVSAEIFFGLKRGGKTFRRALKAVALLGAEVPAVAGLVPLHKMEFTECQYEAVFNQEREFATMSEQRADLELDRRIQQRMHETGEKDYIQAMDWVLVEFPELARQYTEQQFAVALATYARRR